MNEQSWDEYFMRIAIREAEKAADAGEVPVGAVIVCEQTVIAKAHNQTELLKDATAHAEMIAITSAENYLNSKYLEECCLYVTLEPCVMCAGASYWAKLGRIVFGATDLKRGYDNYEIDLLHPKTKVGRGVLEKECAMILQEFFQKKRK